MEEQVRRIMANILSVEQNQISGETSPLDIETWDSLRHMNLVLALEDEFEIEFQESTLSKLTSFNKVCAAINSLR